MKIISLSILSIALSVSLSARENPFEPTEHFLEQKKMIIKANELEKIKKAQEAEAEKIAIKSQQKEIQEKKKALKTVQLEKKSVVKKALQNEYVPEIKENFKVLPFIKIYVVNDVLTIEVDKKYKLLNQDILKPVKKLLFDFEGKVSFYTIRKNIISEDFKSFAVGTHMEDNFFRIVIDVPYDIIHYSEKIDSKNGIITIKKKK